MLYNNYENEGDFRRRFVAPFLARLGFVGVKETHGSNEFGCDFICSELHRVFGHRHYAVVVKSQEKIGMGNDARIVLNQIKQAFAKPIRTSSSPREVRASVVVVMNSGSISDHAMQEMWNDLVRERYGDNVIFLDGRQLQSLWNFAGSDDARRRRSLLIGLRAELMTDANNVGVMIQSALAGLDWMPILTTNLEAVASTPELHEALNLHDCMSLLNALLLIQSRAVQFTTLEGALQLSAGDRQAFQNSAISVRADINRICFRIEEALIAGDRAPSLDPS